MLLKEKRQNKNLKYQTIIGIATVVLVSGICFMLRAYLSYRVTAIILLFVVGVFAVMFDIIPVLIAAVLSAAILNYFFIPPLFAFHISGSDDVLFMVSFFVLSIMNAIFTHKIRSSEKRMWDKEEKEKTINLYNTLFNSLSHELKTPLATILTSVDTLEGSKNILTETQKETLLKQIGIAGNRLSRQVGNMLSMSRLETGILQAKKSWCDINDFIEEQINKLEKDANHSIIFLPDGSFPLFNLDASKMEQILQNILNNAILFTPKGSKINISISLQNDNRLQIIIADNGKGVNDDELSHLFDKFYRVPNSIKGGTGLGLSIVKGYVEFLSGTIRAEHNSPCGLQFIINLPVEISYINQSIET
jgi:two-component system sensor histidine kinase KdpD